MKNLFGFFLSLIIFILILPSFLSVSFASDPLCGICQPGTPLAGQPPIYGQSTSCNNVGPNSSFAQYCDPNCTIAAPTVPNCTNLIVEPIPNATINEGSKYFLDRHLTNLSTNPVTATFNYGDGTIFPEFNIGTLYTVNRTYNNTGVYNVSVTFDDGAGIPETTSAVVTVVNVPPAVGPISLNTSLTTISTQVNALANFTDPGLTDTHVAFWNWGDGNTTSGTVDEGFGTVSGSHVYTTAGVFTVTLRMIDKDNGVGTSTYQYVTVYDPSVKSFLTGAGSYNSPAGALIQNPSATGEVKFGVESKYVANNPTPNGKIRLDFPAGNFSFDTTSYNWLVIGGNLAYVYGTGTVNGSGNYSVLLTAEDSSTDLIRVEIKDSAGNKVYDNEFNSPDFTPPVTQVIRGVVKVH